MSVESSQGLFQKYEELGQRWLRGEVDITEFNGKKLNARQVEFINAKDRYVLVGGGMASGKTTAFIIKLILLCLFFPKNRILLGRKSRMDVERATLPDFFDLCPQGIYEHKVGPGIIEFANGSQIIMMGLDALQSGNGQDIKKAEQSIKSLNLGAFAIDQLEEIEERVFNALTARMRRDVGFQQGFFTTNPANFWALDYFKLHPRPNTRLIETSMFDNQEFLPPGFIEDQLQKPRAWVERYVYGNWTKFAPDESRVFAQEYLDDQFRLIKPPVRTFDGLYIYEEPTQALYQIGVDPSEGSTDPSAITVVRKDTGDVVAHFCGYVPIEVQVDKACQLAYMYSLKEKPLMIPEATGVGAAFIQEAKKKYSRIYERTVFSQREDKQTNKLGFSTNHSTKSLLIENMKKLLQARFARFRSREIVDELSTFIYSDEAHMKGAGAQNGYHDDRLMATMLAYWDVTPVTKREKNLLERLSGQKSKKVVQYTYS